MQQAGLLEKASSIGEQPRYQPAVEDFIQLKSKVADVLHRILELPCNVSGHEEIEFWTGLTHELEEITAKLRMHNRNLTIKCTN